jgi:8-oxo-dGTP pyrophosphatase MutT (NUDIX family)
LKLHQHLQNPPPGISQPHEGGVSQVLQRFQSPDLRELDIVKVDTNVIMSYIRELRQLVGNRPLIMVGAAVLVLDSQKRLLLLRRSDNHCWGIPGGAMEPGESLEDTARRETLEESGLVIGELSLYGVFSGPELYYRYPDGAEVYNVTAVYTPSDVRGELRLDVEHIEAGYFDLHDLPSPLSPPIQPIIEKFKG